MARAALAPFVLPVNGNQTDPAGTASVAGAGNGFAVPAVTGGGAYPEQLLLRVANASGGTGTVSILAGDDPVLAESAGQGPLTVSIATATAFWLGPVESARFLRHDGSIVIETSVVMTITAFKVNRH